MDKPLTENLCGSRERVIGELINGRDLATQLQILLQKPCGDYGSVSADEIMVKILRSFNETLTVLSSCGISGQVSRIPVNTQVGSSSCGDRRSECGGKWPALKNRRGSYKRRRTSNISWTVVSPTKEDGYAWRKYGHKEILNAKYPRCYFRCTHKFDQGCKATKQVQRMEDNSTMYQTTYFCQHTCRDFFKAPHEMASNTNNPEDFYLLSFESKIQSCEQDHQVKGEAKEEIQSELSDNIISPLDSFIWPDLMALESPRSTFKLGFEVEDVISSFIDFENTFHFDEN